MVGHICGHLGHSVGPCTDEHLRNIISRCDNGSFVGLYSVTPLYKDTKNNLCNNLDLKYFQILVQYKQTIVILNNQGIFYFDSLRQHNKTNYTNTSRTKKVRMH